MPVGGVFSHDRVLAQAVRQAVETCGGAEIAQRETGLGKSQLYRCMSPNDNDSLSLRNALTIDRLSGDPAILRAYARILGAVVVLLPDVADSDDCFVQSVIAMSAELGDVSRAIGDALRDGQIEKAEARDVIVELDHVIDLAVAVRKRMTAIVNPAKGEAR